MPPLPPVKHLQVEFSILELFTTTDSNPWWLIYNTPPEQLCLVLLEPVYVSLTMVLKSLSEDTKVFNEFEEIKEIKPPLV